MSTKQRVIYLEWKDATGTQGWYAKGAELHLAHIRSIGWLVNETKNAITITTGIADDGGSMGLQSIPKACIIKRRYVKL
jgi:hypothetical protein